MNSRNLTLLSLVAVLIIGAAIWVGHSRTPQSVVQQSLYPDLTGKLSAVQGITIHKALDQVAVELTRNATGKNSTWQVKQRHNYPADTHKIDALLINLEDAKLREQKTANKENYSALGVQDLSDATATGVRLELTGSPSPVDLIVGKRDATRQGTYVRRAGAAPSWLISTELDVPADATKWLKRDLIDIAADRIQEATTQLSGAPSYSVFKNARPDANFDVKGIPKRRELNSVAAANAVAQALVALQLDDVRLASELAAEKPAGKTEFKTFDGLTVECVGYKIGEQRWIALHAGFDAELAKRFQIPTVKAAGTSADKIKADKDKTEPKAAAASDAATQDAIKKMEDEANSLNAATSSWAYAIPTYKYDAIFKPLEDLLKKPDLLKKK